MAESKDDADVDVIIADIQAQLDRLKAAQRKDVQDESSEEEKETPREAQPKDLRTASVRVREHFRQVRRRQEQ